MQLENLSALYLYLDNLVIQDVNDDELFASSYIRGFISLASGQYGDESQALTPMLSNDISEKIKKARTELTPQDREIVKQYWLKLSSFFN
jgi:hypothetical protein